MGAAAAAVGAAAASYMAFEAQWPACREAELAVPGLPVAVVGRHRAPSLRRACRPLSPPTNAALARWSTGRCRSSPTWCFSPETCWAIRRRSARSLELARPASSPAGDVRRHRQPRVRPGQGAAGQSARRPATSGARPGVVLLSRPLCRPSAARRHPAGPLRRRSPHGRLRPPRRSPGGGLRGARLEAPAAAGGGPAPVPGRPSRPAATPSPSSSSMSPPRPTPPSRHCSRWPSPVTRTAASCGFRGLTASRRWSTKRASTSRAYTSGARGRLVVVQGSGNQLPALPPAHQAGGDPLAIGINFPETRSTRIHMR